MTGFLRRGMWSCLWCLLRRRQDGAGDGVQPFTPAAPPVSTLTVLLAVAAGGVVASGLLVPWTWLRVLGVLGCLWLLLAVVALTVCGRTHPHLLGDDALVLRHLGAEVARLPRAAVRAELLDAQSSPAPGVGSGRLHLPGPSGTTNVRLVVDPPVPARIAGRDLGEVGEVTLGVTTPLTLVGELTSAR